MTEDIWYVASGDGPNGRPGYTSQADQALKDNQGVPIICPGGIKRIFDRRREQHARELDNLWEHLLDLMEVMFIAKEHMDDTGGREGTEAYKEAKHRVRATIEALAILEYGYLWAEDKENGTKTATGKVAQTAKVKYEQSAEG